MKGTEVPIHEFEAALERPDAVGAWTFLRVPFNVEEAFGAKARVAVKGAVNGAAFRSSLLPQGEGAHILVVNKTLRTLAKADVGDTVQVTLERDDEPRTVEAPDDLRQALELSDDLSNFEDMSYSRQKEYVDWIESAKRADTRVRRIEKAAAMIRENLRLKG